MTTRCCIQCGLGLPDLARFCGACGAVNEMNDPRAQGAPRVPQHAPAARTLLHASPVAHDPSVALAGQVARAAMPAPGPQDPGLVPPAPVPPAMVAPVAPVPQAPRQDLKRTMLGFGGAQAAPPQQAAQPQQVAQQA